MSKKQGMGILQVGQVKDEDREKLFKSIKSLANNINAKRTKFDTQGFKKEYDKKLQNSVNGIFINESGNITKSIREYRKLTNFELINLHNDLYRLQHSETFGTTTKYVKTRNKKIEIFRDSLNDIIGKEKVNKMSENDVISLMENVIKAKETKQIETSEQYILSLYSENINDKNEKEYIKEELSKAKHSRDLLNRLGRQNRRKDLMRR